MTVARSRAVRGLAAALVLLAAPRPVAAQSAGEPATVAEALFRDGVALFEAGRVHEACAKFAESYRLDPANGTLQNEALCHAREGKVASAWAEFALLAGRAAQSGQRAREQMARAQVEQLERRVARVSLVFDAPGDVTEARVDGEPLGRPAWTTPLPLDPGPHTFEFRGPGRKPLSRALIVPVGPASVRLAVPALEEEQPAPSSASAPPPAPPMPETQEMQADASPSRGGARRPIALVTGGVGIALVGVGTYFGLRALSKKNDSESHCAGRYCDVAGLALDGEAHTAATWSTIAFGAGVAAVGAAIVLWVTGPGSAGRAAPATAVRVLPAIGARGAALSLQAAW